ncbi:hypothetical protein BKA69DRAFT_1094440 [Paraphysoderma sedebokerense]|nr:hypothetical protein BKA69DRAFT_1094440 [Paraphysoderma sedebokerense]
MSACILQLDCNIKLGRCIEIRQVSTPHNINMATLGAIFKSHNGVWGCSAGHVFQSNNNKDISACIFPCANSSCASSSCVACHSIQLSSEFVAHPRAPMSLQHDIGAFKLSRADIYQPQVIRNVQETHHNNVDIGSLNGVGHPTQPSLGATVFKRGVTTGWTVGKVLCIQGGLVEITTMQNQPLSMRGDSGALWFQVVSNLACPVAFHVAGDPQRNRAIAVNYEHACHILSELLHGQVSIDIGRSYQWE